jgi:hypothetical protein
MAVLKLVPVIVTEVPPAVEPLVGLRPVTVGGESTNLDSIDSILGWYDFDRFNLRFNRTTDRRVTMATASKGVPT